MLDCAIAQEQTGVLAAKSVTSDLLATAQRMLLAGYDFEAKVLTSLAKDTKRALSAMPRSSEPR